MTEAISPQVLSQLISSIYDCALEPNRWDRTLSELRDAFGSETAQLGLMDLRRGRMLINRNVGMEPSILEVQARHVPEMSAIVRKFFGQNSLDEPHVFSRHIGPDELKTSLYLQFALRAGFVDMMTYTLLSEPAHYSGFGVGRLKRQGILTERDIELGPIRYHAL